LRRALGGGRLLAVLHVGGTGVTGLGSTLATFPNFVVYFIIGAVLTAIFVALYANLTPHRDIALIRGGNSAAAVALVGALLGFEVPLASVIAHSAALVDLMVWGVIALVVQLGGFLVARMVLPHLPQAIEDGNIADAVFLAGLSLALGILDAACMAG
jgi:putative membrane protein